MPVNLSKDSLYIIFRLYRLAVDEEPNFNHPVYTFNVSYKHAEESRKFRMRNIKHSQFKQEQHNLFVTNSNSLHVYSLLIFSFMMPMI